MDEFNNITYRAIAYYYKQLENLGYMPTEDLDKIRALTAINDIINIFSQYITDEDYLSIMKALDCLSKSSCFIDFPHFLTQESIFKESNRVKQYQYRLSEDSLFRLTEDNVERLVD